MEQNTKRKATLSLEKAISIIELLAETPHPMRLLDISEQTKIPPSTALRLLSTLQSHGYINQDSITSRYSLSLKLFHIGCKVSNNISIISKARSALEISASYLKRSLNFAILQNDEIFVLEVIGGAFEAPVITIQSGNRVPLYCTALGRAILSYYKEEDVIRYCATHQLYGYTNLTTTNPHELINELRATQIRGYAYDKGEFRHGISGVGVAIPDGSDIPSAAISVAFLSSELSQSAIESLGIELKKTAIKISQSL